MVLTLKMENEPGKFHIETERYQNRAEPIWEILPLELPSEPYALSAKIVLPRLLKVNHFLCELIVKKKSGVHTVQADGKTIVEAIV